MGGAVALMRPLHVSAQVRCYLKQELNVVLDMPLVHCCTRGSCFIRHSFRDGGMLIPVDDTEMRFDSCLCRYSVVNEHVYETKKAAWKRRRSARNSRLTATPFVLCLFPYTLGSIRERL